MPFRRPIPPQGEMKQFPGTGGPMLFLHPNRATVPIYGQPRDTVMFFPPPGYYTPAPKPRPPGPRPGPNPGPGPGPGPQPPPGPDPTLVQVTTSEHRDCQLCGFDEFVNPSVPPKKYRRRALEGAMTKHAYWGTDGSCVYGAPPEGVLFCSGNVAGSFDSTFDATITAKIISETASLTTYEVTYIANQYPNVTVASTLSLGITPTTPALTPITGGYRFTVQKEHSIHAQVLFNVIVFQQIIGCPGLDIVAGSAPFQDVWASFYQYSSSDCSFSEDISVIRTYEFTGLTADLALDPTYAAAVAAGLPLTVYAPLVSGDFIIEPDYVAQGTTTATHKSYTGLGCQDNPNEFGTSAVLGVGTIDENLEDEDTEADAIARADGVAGTSNIAFYEPRTLFTFEYQTVSVDFGMVGLEPGTSYEVHLPVTTADYGGANPVDSVVVYSFTATGTTKDIHDLIAAERGQMITVGEGVLV